MRKPNLITIYSLNDPDNGKPRYVGSTTYLKYRIRQHKSEHRFRERRPYHKLTPKLKWLRDLESSGKWFTVSILEECEEALRGEREDYWMRELTRQGFKLTNTRISGSKTY